MNIMYLSLAGEVPVLIYGGSTDECRDLGNDEYEGKVSGKLVSVTGYIGHSIYTVSE